MQAAIYTLGCKVNQYETQAMEQELVRRGHTLVPRNAMRSPVPATAWHFWTCWSRWAARSR